MRIALLLSLLAASPLAVAGSSSSASAPAPANSLVQPAESSDKKSDEKAKGGEKDQDEKGKKPQLSLRASPPISFSPANIHLVAELKGGADDYEEFYCPAIEWDWGDGTRSEN